MKPTETREWGIWYTGVYTVGHFLKMLGPESGAMRFTTKQAAEAYIVGKYTPNRYVAREIPAPKPLPEKN